MNKDQFKRKNSSDEESQDDNDADKILGNDQSSKHVVRRDMNNNPFSSQKQSGIVIMAGYNNEEAIIEQIRVQEGKSEHSHGSSYKPSIYDEKEEDRQSKSLAITDKKSKRQHQVIQIEYFNQKNKPIQNYNKRPFNNQRSNYDYNSNRNPTQYYNNHHNNYSNFSNNRNRNNHRQRNRYEDQNQNQNQRYYGQTNYPYQNHNPNYYQNYENRYYQEEKQYGNYGLNERQNHRGRESRIYQNNYQRGNNNRGEQNYNQSRYDRQANNTNVNTNYTRSNPSKNTNKTIDQQENQNQNTYLMNQAQQSIQINNSNNKSKGYKDKQQDQSSEWIVQDDQNNDQQENQQQVQANQNDSLSLQMGPQMIHKNYNALEQENSRHEEDISLLNALDGNFGKKDQKQQKEGNQNKKIQEVLSIQKINQLLSTSIDQSKLIFSQQELQALNQLFDKFSQIQPKKVQIKVKCSNVQSYFIKTISSEIYGIKNQKPDSLKDNGFIKILECKKNVPRDSQPNGSNQQIPINQNKDNKIIEKKVNKIILAQIKYPLDLLDVSKEIAQLNEEKYNRLIDLIKSHSKNLKKQESILKIEQISLICSHCSDRKKHNWNGDPIVHPCVKECANILRFQIQSMHFC